ncbi:pentatricopeptide repeat-containing protein At5g59600-like [Amaranthus tricolor]|uniref:pentatricopeptide repeat-containing protein At5g59600-like n=1 Tax=Amaranthus tricolor TaxID=29722 RepID=UPI00258DCE1D|nr:pentatricopeptide repeat-containing protein At5g59600-like [Amaranthus tricolor]
MRLSSLFWAYKLSYDELSTILQRCTKLKILIVAKQIHGMLITNGIDVKKMSLDAKILGVYASCGNMRYAHQLFVKMPSPNVFAFNWMISVMAFHGYYQEALEYFFLMQKIEIFPNKYTFSVVLKACVGLLDLNKGREVHGLMNKMGLEGDVLVCNGLIDMYCKCGIIHYARRVFDGMLSKDVASWTSMISGYINTGKLDEAVVLFEGMKMEGLDPNEFTWNVLMNGFAQRGDKKGALELFSRMSKAGMCHDLVTWNALISGFARGNQPTEALKLFRDMLVSGVRPNHVTVTGLLPVYGLMGFPQRGRELHGLIYRQSLEVNVYVVSALIDMYSKSGNVKAARNVFKGTHFKNVALWNVIIGCLGKHGVVYDAIRLFDEMQKNGFRPNEVTLVCVLSACSHGGLVQEGMEIFRSMKEKYHVEATKEHYACVVDLLSRAGEVEEAYELMKRMPMEATESIIGAFLNGCRIHGRRDLADRITDYLLNGNVKKPGAFVTLSNIHAAEKEWQEVHNVRKLMKGEGINKKHGFSLVDKKY